MNRLKQWCERFGVGKYADILLENEVDFEILAELTDVDLKELDIPLGARKKILKGIASLTAQEEETDIDSPLNDRAEANISALNIEAERRQLTVMFIDLVGSTALSVQYDPEEVREIMSVYRDFCATVIKRFDGHIVRYLGDGILTFFGYPKAHEDDAERAILAGLDLVEEIGQLKVRDDLGLQIRIGIATGPVVVGDLFNSRGAGFGNEVVGETPNLAARLQGVADSNEVVIAESTKHLVRGLFEYINLGEHDLKGFPEPIPAWKVTGRRAVESRFDAVHSARLTPLVGRDEETELLERRWSQAKTGSGQVVLLSGEAGIGKSRIAQYMRQRLRNEPHTHLLYYCSPYYQNSALFPMIDQLERAARLTRDDSSEEKLDKLEYLLAQSDPASISKNAPLMASLLSIPAEHRYGALNMSPQRLKEEILDSLIAQLQALVTHKPVLMIFEDLHWIDPTTLDLLDRLLDQIQTMPVLIIMTFRPDFTPPWVGHPFVSLRTLNRLDENRTAEIAAELSGGKVLPQAVMEQIILRTDGVPLFVEELTKTVLEAGFLKDEGDHYSLDGPLPSFAIPSTLQDSLMARLDRLAAAKEIIQIGAVIGRSFSYELMAELSGLKDQKLRHTLEQLTQTKLISGRGLPPNATYAFKHALVRDAAYLSLLRRQQQMLHARIAKVLEDRFAERVETEPELVAYHYTEAGLAATAIDYWYKAGQRAVDRSSNTEALAHLERGLELLQEMPPDKGRDRMELRLQTARAAALQASKGFSAKATGEAYQRARELCAKLSDMPEIFPVLHGFYLFHVLRGEIDLAYDASKECLLQALRQNDATALLFGHRTVGASLLHLGQFKEAYDHLSKLLELAESNQQTQLSSSIYGLYPKTAATTFLGLTLFALGYPDKAAKAAKDAESNAQAVGHLQNLGFALFWANKVGLQLRAFEAVLERAKRLKELGQQQGLPQWAAFGRFQHGLALTMLKDCNTGIDEMQQALQEHRALGSKLYLPSMLGNLAFCQLRLTHYAEAQANLDEALMIAHKNREVWFLAELYRLKGEHALAQNDAVAAEGCFMQALEIAREQNARSWELRAARSLAQLWYKQGKRQAAADLLGPVFNWFQEGHGSVDLTEARELLGQLGAKFPARLAADNEVAG